MYKMLLCLRYLRTRYIALASIISVMLGVATMIVVNSVMAGFTHEMRDRIHGFLADVVVESKSMNGLQDADAQLAIVRDAAGEFISAMTPTVEVPGMIGVQDTITGERFQMQVQLVGIDPNGKAEVGQLKDYLGNFQPDKHGHALRSPSEKVSFELTPEAMAYRQQMKSQAFRSLNFNNSMESTPPSPVFDEPDSAAAIPAPDFDTPDTAVAAENSLPDSIFAPMKREVQADPAAPAAALLFFGEQITSYQLVDPDTGERRIGNMVTPGDDVFITTVRGSTPPEPSSFNATVVDMFRSGMSEYDSSLVLMNIEELQKVRGMEGAITTIQIRLKDYGDADEVVRRLRAAFPPGLVTVSTWEAKQGLLLSAVEVETAILNVLLFMIIAVAGFGILAIFFMIVVEKTRDIGILKALGASSNGIMSIFLSYGIGLGIVGSAAGVGIGILFVKYINEIETGLSWVTGRKVFDKDIYYFDAIPTLISPAMVMWVALGAIGIAVMASVLPARRASRLHPVRALRYE